MALCVHPARMDALAVDTVSTLLDWLDQMAVRIFKYAERPQ